MDCLKLFTDRLQMDFMCRCLVFVSVIMGGLGWLVWLVRFVDLRWLYAYREC